MGLSENREILQNNETTVEKTKNTLNIALMFNEGLQTFITS